MPRSLDLTDQRFGRLVALRPVVGSSGRREWECRCECGAVEAFPTSRLTLARATACRACSGSRTAFVVDRACAACGGPFRGHPNADYCSPECYLARRRGQKAGVDHLPPPIRACDACGVSFRPSRNRATCSPECDREKKRRRALAEFRARVAADPDLSKRVARRRRERAANDPEYAARVATWEAAKWARHRERMATDPEYAQVARERARAHYQRNAAEIQRRRRARLEAMSDEAFAELIERTRRHGREHRRRRRADPIKADRDRDVIREWRRRRRSLQWSRLMADVSARLDSPSRVKPCVECGKPIVGRKAQARTCSRKCARAVVLRKIAAARAAARKLPSDRVCPICSTPIDPTTSRITCSDPCRAERKRRSRIQAEEPSP